MTTSIASTASTASTRGGSSIKAAIRTLIEWHRKVPHRKFNLKSACRSAGWVVSHSFNEWLADHSIQTRLHWKWLRRDAVYSLAANLGLGRRPPMS